MASFDSSIIPNIEKISLESESEHHHEEAAAAADGEAVPVVGESSGGAAEAATHAAAGGTEAAAPATEAAAAGGGEGKKLHVVSLPSRGDGAGHSGHAVNAKALAEALAGKPPKGFRFPGTKSPREQAPPGLAEQIFEAAKDKKRLHELIHLCQEWAGHSVVDEHTGSGHWLGSKETGPRVLYNGHEYKRSMGTGGRLGRRRANTALMMAAFESVHTESLRVLIAAGGDINATNSEGHDALHLAIMFNRPEHAQILINEGASLSPPALEMAKASGHTKIATMLEKAGAK